MNLGAVADNAGGVVLENHAVVVRSALLVVLSAAHPAHVALCVTQTRLHPLRLAEGQAATVLVAFACFKQINQLDLCN